MFSWGGPGDGTGEFVTPHNVCVDRAGTVYVADRQNRRMQLFNPQGEFITQWDDIWWPCDMCFDDDDRMYVAEVGGIFMGATKDPALDNPPARITVRDMLGRILSEWGMEDPLGAGRYFSPHNIAFDSRGDLYVGEGCGLLSRRIRAGGLAGVEEVCARLIVEGGFLRRPHSFHRTVVKCLCRGRQKRGLLRFLRRPFCHALRRFVSALPLCTSLRSTIFTFPNIGSGNIGDRFSFA